MFKLVCFVVLFNCAVMFTYTSARNVVKVLNATNGAAAGSWYEPEMCPSGSFAAGFQLRVQQPQGDEDDTAANAVRLLCKTKYNREVATVNSYEGIWGEWSTRQDCLNLYELTTFISAFSLKVEESQGEGDDTAMNNMRVYCRSWFQSSGQGYTLEGTGGQLGDWGPISAQCPPNSAVCGLRVAFEGSLPDSDDVTALNDVQLYCCDD